MAESSRARWLRLRYKVISGSCHEKTRWYIYQNDAEMLVACKTERMARKVAALLNGMRRYYKSKKERTGD